MNNFTIWLMFLVVVVIALCRGMLVDESKAVRHLQTLGFSNIEITDKSWLFVPFLGCSEKDAAKFTANATNPAGGNVQVEVCVGWPFKGATLRTS